eukprot:UN00680
MANTSGNYKQLQNDAAEGVHVNNDPPPAYAPQYQQAVIQPQPVIQAQPVMQPQPVVIQPQHFVTKTQQQVNAGYPGNYQQQTYATQTYATQQPQVVIVPSQPTTTIVTRGPQRNNYNDSPQYMGKPEPYQDLCCLSCLVCLFCNWICGLCALFFTSNAQSAHARGDFDEYRRQQANAKGCIALSCITGFIFLIFIIVGQSY